jgi:dihydroceramidase
MNSRKLGEKDLGSKLPYLALINLGFASGLFHSSLKYSMQMCDEFSMLIATFIVFYQLLSFSQTMIAPRILLGALCALMLVVIVAQIVTGESTVQQIVFTGIVYWLWHMCFKLIGNFDSEDAVKRRMRWMAISGIGTSSTVSISKLPSGYITGIDLYPKKAFFVTGHACWVTDFYACDGLREIRRNIGMPWAAVFELHGLYVLPILSNKTRS